MTKQNKIEIINTILEKKIYNFHELDEENMVLISNNKSTPATAYYAKRELVDLMNDLFDNDIAYRFDENTNQIYIK